MSENRFLKVFENLVTQNDQTLQSNFAKVSENQIIIFLCEFCVTEILELLATFVLEKQICM